MQKTAIFYFLAKNRNALNIIQIGIHCNFYENISSSIPSQPPITTISTLTIISTLKIFPPWTDFPSRDCLACSAEEYPLCWTRSSNITSLTGFQCTALYHMFIMIMLIMVSIDTLNFMLKCRPILIFPKYFTISIIKTLPQRWRNVPAHLKLHADRSSTPPRELHLRGAPAGGGQVLRASRWLASHHHWVPRWHLVTMVTIFTPIPQNLWGFFYNR